MTKITAKLCKTIKYVNHMLSVNKIGKCYGYTKCSLFLLK